MSTTNPWLNPLQRSYNQIKAKLIENLKLKVPEITDFSEGNIFMILISIFASISEVLHYYIDNMASETFFITARRYSSLKKHAKMVDYHIRCANPSQVDILLSLVDGGVLGQDIYIPSGIVFTSLDGKPYLSTKNLMWKAGSYSILVPVIQKELVEEVTFGINTSDDIVIYLGTLGNGLFYAEGSMSISLSGIPWELVDTFAYSKPNSKHYMVELDDNYLPYIKFGNGTYGMKPPTNSTIVGSFYATYGDLGNQPAGTITAIPQTLFFQLPEGVSITCINPHASTGGSNYENFDMVKENLPLSIKTLGVAISADDYESIARLAPGVDKAYVNYKCGKFIDIYITPYAGGIASSGLLDDTYKFILKRKVITTSIKLYPTIEAHIVLAATITGKKSFKANDINLQVISSLFSSYSYNTSDIAKPVRLSDLYSLIDNLPMVDFLKIDNLYIIPIFTKVGATTQVININSINLITVLNTNTYVIKFSSIDGKLHILRGNNQDTGVTITPSTPTTINLDGNNWQVNISPPTSGVYTNGDMWRFTLPQNKIDQEISDFTIPIFNDISNITLVINEVV